MQVDAGLARPHRRARSGGKSRGAPCQRNAQCRTAVGGEDHTALTGPPRGRPGPCRDRQDDDAEGSGESRGRDPGDRPGALEQRGADPGTGDRPCHEDPPVAPHPLPGCRGRNCGRGIPRAGPEGSRRQDPRGRRGLAHQHVADARVDPHRRSHRDRARCPCRRQATVEGGGSRTAFPGFSRRPAWRPL